MPRFILPLFLMCLSSLALSGPAERLSQAVRFQTISSQDPAQVDYATFEAINAFLEVSYPRVFRRAHRGDRERLQPDADMGRLRAGRGCDPVHRTH